MAVTDAPKIITTRFEVADGHTLAGYERTGGYAALRAALGRTPADVLTCACTCCGVISVSALRSALYPPVRTYPS